MDPKDAKSLNPRAIFSKTGKGVQEASGKTSHLSRADRAVLAAVDGKTPLSDISAKFDKLSAEKFDALIQQLDKDGFVREVSSGQSVAPTPRPAAPAAKAPPKAPPPADDGDDMDFTQAIKLPPKSSAPAAPKPPSMDLAAAARAEAERKLKDQELDYKARQEAELKARAAAEAKAKAEAEARARAAAEAEAKTRAEADAKVKAAREAAVRMATEAKARAEAEAKAKADAAEREKARVEAELNAKLDAERKAREDAERRAAEAAEQARKDLEEKAKRDAEEMRQRLEAEMKAKLDAERKAREEEDRKRREEEDRKRKEEDARRAKEDAERRAREEAERKKREEEDRKRKEEDERRRKEEDERRAKEQAERKAREEEDRKRKEAEARRAKDEAERRAKEEAEKRSREEAERKKRDEEERKRRDEDERRRKEEDARRAKEDAEAKARAAATASLPAIEPAAPPPPAAAAAPAGDLGDLLGDLDNFGKREEEERQAKEEADRQAKEAAARKAKEAAERQAREEAEAKRREDEERRRKEEDEQRAKDESERKAREEEERKSREEKERRKQEEEEAERKRKAKAALAANLGGAQSRSAAGAAGGDGGVDVGDEDFDMDDIKRDQKALAKRAAESETPVSAIVAARGRPKRWGKPVAIAVFALLVVGIGVLHVMPVSTASYEKGASEALGVPVKIGSARMSLITGVELKFENVAIGDAAKIRLVRGTPDIGSLFGERKSFSRVDLEGVSMGQSQIAGALLGKAAGTNFRVGRVTIKQLSLDGPLKLPPLDVDAALSDDGSVQTVRLAGDEKLSVQISPKGSEMAFEVSAGSLALPFVPALSLSEFGMKGTANRDGITSSEFDGRAYDGVISGTARIRWGASWTVEGEVRARGVKVAVFAPALVSEGKVEGRATYAMSGTAPGQLYEGARMQGEFKIDKGVLGSFDLTRALQTGGAQSTGRTVFNELKGQGVYDKGAVQLRDISISAGAMNAGASVDIDASGGISGRVAADVKTPNQTLRAVLNISGKVQAPVIRK